MRLVLDNIKKSFNEKNVLNGVAWNFEQALAIVEGKRTIETEESKC